MKNAINKIENKINLLFDIASENFATSSQQTHDLRMARIDGMIEALEMLTDNKYTLTKNGLTKAE